MYIPMFYKICEVVYTIESLIIELSLSEFYLLVLDSIGISLLDIEYLKFRGLLEPQMTISKSEKKHRQRHILRVNVLQLSSARLHSRDTINFCNCRASHFSQNGSNGGFLK